MLPYRMLIARERSHRGVRTHAGSVLVVNMPPSKRKQILKRNSEQAPQIKAARGVKPLQARLLRPATSPTI